MLREEFGNRIHACVKIKFQLGGSGRRARRPRFASCCASQNCRVRVFAEFVEAAGANHGLQFFRQRADPLVEIGQGRKPPLRARGQQPLPVRSVSPLTRVSGTRIAGHAR